MSFDVDGFLSPDVAQWITKHRSENAGWFKLCERLSRLAFSQFKKLSVPGGDRVLLLRALLFVRALSNYQASLLLAERGLTSEARTLTRSCLEAIFHLGAVTNEPSRVDNFIDDDITNKRKLARALRSLPQDHGVNGEADNRMEAYLEETQGHEARKFDTADVAKAAGMKALYDVYFRPLSNDAVHTSLSSLRRCIEETGHDDLRGFRFGPDVDDVLDAVAIIAVMGILLASLGCGLVADEALGCELEMCRELYRKHAAELADGE